MPENVLLSLTAEHSDDTPTGYELPEFFAVADRFVDLYVTYRKRYVMMINGAIFVPKQKGGGTIPLSNSIICKHLHKKFAISIFAGAHSSKFVCFDVDDGNRDTVHKIISLAEQFGIPREYVYVSSSGGKGYHVEVFFDNLVYTEKLRVFYDWVVITGKLNRSKVEFRPTANQAIKLPLSRHVKTGNICWYLNPETFEPYEYDAYVLEIQQFSAETFNSLVSECGLRKPISGDFEDKVCADTDPEKPQTRSMTKEEVEEIFRTSSYPDITQPGQRHALTRAIAIYNRKIGMTQEESERALGNWWAVQDRNITSTSDKEAHDDICSLVAWTFSDNFVIPHRVKKMEITQDMMRLVMSMDTKTGKKLMFLLCCYCSVYGRMNMSYKRMAEYIGCNAVSVRRLVEALVDEGYIRMMCDKPVFVNGQYVRKPNTYYITKEAYEGTKDFEAQFIFEDPIIHEAEERSEPDENGRIRSIVPELEPEGFTDFYYLTIRQTLSKKSQKDLLTRSEYKALRDQERIQMNCK